MHFIGLNLGIFTDFTGTETLYQVRDELNRVKLLQNQQQTRLTKLLTLHYEQASFRVVGLFLPRKYAP